MNDNETRPNILEYVIVIIMVIVSTVAAMFGKVVLPHEKKNEYNPDE